MTYVLDILFLNWNKKHEKFKLNEFYNQKIFFAYALSSFSKGEIFPSNDEKNLNVFQFFFLFCLDPNLLAFTLLLFGIAINEYYFFLLRFY